MATFECKNRLFVINFKQMQHQNRNSDYHDSHFPNDEPTHMITVETQPNG